MKARFFSRQFNFKFPAGTSRGVLHTKMSSFLVLTQSSDGTYHSDSQNDLSNKPSTGADPDQLGNADGLVSDLPQQTNDFPAFRFGVGECSTIQGLSPDPLDSYEAKLHELCNAINHGDSCDSVNLIDYPSIRFGLETALLELKSGGELTNKQLLSPSVNTGRRTDYRSEITNKQQLSPRKHFSDYSDEDFLAGPHILFPSAFTKGAEGIPINGLIWMGKKEFMQKQIRTKLDEGYRCLKMKVGALDFDTELDILRAIRSQFPAHELELRVDANGAFPADKALWYLEKLSEYQIHSVEQPIRQAQHEAMKLVCRNSPIPVALDEELIAYPTGRAVELLQYIQPAYIILKPSLIGGFGVAQQWIEAAESNAIGWWVTSALESNIGLNAIAQWTFTLNNPMPQGLGTGQLFNNNIPSPLEIRNAMLMFNDH